MDNVVSRKIKDIEKELNDLQLAYINEDDEIEQLEIERKFSYLLEEATATDGILRAAAGVTINNWIPEQFNNLGI